ncbi:MAG: RNA methyltransferase [Caldilineaceae bacterium]|nr:RNA methyltransferase [Caldilineaceae bacterium]
MSHFGIGIYQVKSSANVGVLWRGAYQLGAAFVFTIGPRYKPESADVFKTWQQIPLFRYNTFDEMFAAMPYATLLVGVEMGGTPLPGFGHPRQAIYLLGAEDHGLPPSVLARCQATVSIPAARRASYNVAQAGTLVMYDRFVKEKQAEE